ncbi:MAG: hypothetical protein PHU53_02400 [Thermoplasmata archaeon]|nr:hypothetical protein [Thermoplasmata archaeon]
MLEGEPDPDDRKYVPAYRSEGQIYFSGTANRSDVPYSKGAKAFGAILVVCLIMFIAWVMLSMIGVI